MSGSLLLLLGLLGIALAANALRPLYGNRVLSGLSFFAGWLTAELAPQWIVAHAITAALLVATGGLSSWRGRLGLALVGLAIGLLGVSLRRSTRAAAAVDDGLLAGLGTTAAEPLSPGRRAIIDARVSWRHLAWPRARRAGVARVRNVIFHQQGGLRLRLDVYHRVGALPTELRPALIYFHGGAWVIGDKSQQGLPLVNALAQLGWVCFNANYRLSPRATFPDHLVDVKRAIAWVRAHAAEWGVDPRFIAVAGGSAGGHLASLAALTAGRSEYQPGFAAADTRVAACVSLYGIYDLADRDHAWPHPGMRHLTERFLLKARLRDAPAAFDRASPVTEIHPDAPPFLIVHGECDSIVPVAAARSFVARLRARSRAPVVYVEVPGAQHAFEVFASTRTTHVLRGVMRFLTVLHERLSDPGDPPG